MKMNDNEKWALVAILHCKALFLKIKKLKEKKKNT